MMKKTGTYKKTGNLAIDIVAGCINHYARFKKPLERIVLHPKLWASFCEFVKAQIPMYDFSDDTVDFDGVKIVKGTTLMIKDMYWEFGKVKKLEVVN